MPLFLSSQTKKDSILNSLRNEISGISFRKKDDSTKILVYKLCESRYEEVAYLKHNLKESEINALLHEENAALNIIGYIILLEKNNTKQNAFEILNILIKIINI